LTPPAEIAVPRPSATLLLLRDGPNGLEVLMMTRHADDVAFAGAMVFPGGRVDAEDGDPAVQARCRAVAGLDAAAMAFRVAAIRESFEEAHILLARRVGEEALLSAADVAALEARLAATLGRTPHFGDLVSGGGIELATDRLVRFAHWITPARSAHRFDAHFFLAPTPADQAPAADGVEAVAIDWTTPAGAIAGADARRQRLVFATRSVLAKLGRSRDVATALAAAAADRVVTVCPEVYDTPDGPRIRIPPDAGYDISEMPMRPGWLPKT
jgi:8-oxo-dGTP pyrophosphatase MutT (NUDIX family)